MKTLGALVLAAVAASAALPASPQLSSHDVRLVLLVAVDQFRYDYLTRFRGEYTDGIKRLLSDGAVFTNANLEHYPTVTAIGHATMLTGATPAVSGIIGNDWFDRQTGATVTSVSDPTVKPLGAETGSAASPRRLLVSTVGDELKMASPMSRNSAEASRVFGVSLKDRSAILPVGRGADAAYWWDTKTGSFATSSYYVPEAPDWVRTFNERKPADAQAGASWTVLLSPATSLRLMPAELGATLYDAIYGSPFGNDLLLNFAGELLTRERLGQRNATDLLSVSFSSNDSVGHTYGPDSPQVRDMAVRTDRAIGQLLTRVDKLVGLEHTLVAFTSDHGVAPVPEWLQERTRLGGRITTSELFDPIQKALTAQFGGGQWMMSAAGSSPYLNDGIIEQRQLDGAAVRRVAAEAAAKVPHVARVYTRDQLLRGE